MLAQSTIHAHFVQCKIENFSYREDVYTVQDDLLVGSLFWRMAIYSTFRQY